MKKLWMLFFAITTFSSFAQEETGLPKEKLYEAKKQLREGNELYKKNKLDDAAIAYQKSLAEDGTYYKGAYNLGNAYFQQKKYKEAGEQYQLANKLAKTKEDKAKTSELIGDTFKKQNELEKALESYKQALLKKPTDDVLREKFVAAKKQKEKQDQQNKDNKDKNKDNKDDNKDKDNKGDNKDQNKDNKGDKDQDKKDDKGDKDKKEDDQKDGENPEDKKDQGDKGEDEKQDQQPAQPNESKLSPEQIQQLLESMNNEEQKTQKKVNAQKVNAKENNNEKDW